MYSMMHHDNLNYYCLPYLLFQLHRIALKLDKGRTGDPEADFANVIPYHAVAMGCSFQICYVRKGTLVSYIIDIQ